MGSIGHQIAKGAAWAMLMRFASRALGFASTVILARLLTPDDYGVIALAMIFIGLLEAISWFGFDVVLIQDQEAPLEKYHTVWTLTLLRGVILASIIFVGAPYAAAIFDEPRLIAVLQILALSPLVDGFGNIGIVDFRKNLQFDRDFKVMVFPRLAGFVITLSLALVWRDYWALAIGMVSGRVVALFVSYAMHPYRPRISTQYWHEVFGFSKWLLANSLLRYGYLRGASVMLGKIAGAQALGVYTIAYEISNLVLTDLVAPIQRAILPGYAKLASSAGGLREAYLAVFGLTITCALPLAGGIALTAHLFVPLLLGDKWLETIPLIRVLTLGGMLHVGVANSGAVYVAVGKPWLTTMLYLVAFVVGLPLIAWGALASGALGASWGVVGMSAAYVMVNAVFISRVLSLDASAIILRCLRPGMATLAMVATVLGLSRLREAPSTASELVIALLAAVVAGGAVHIATNLALWNAAGRPDGAERHILSYLAVRYTASRRAAP